MNSQNMKTRLTLDEARAIVSDESRSEIERAAANTVISLTAACEALQTACDGYEEDLKRWRERGRLLADEIRRLKGGEWEPQMLKGWE